MGNRRANEVRRVDVTCIHLVPVASFAKRSPSKCAERDGELMGVSRVVSSK